MGREAILRGAEPREILQSLIEKRVPAIMSYLSRRKWHVAKVLLTNLGADRLDVQILSREKPQPINIKIGQPVGISLKHGYGKVVFEASVIAFEPSLGAGGGGTIVMEVPDRLEVVQRRNYFRVKVPDSLKVNMLLWHRRQKVDGGHTAPNFYWQGRLVDLSAGGAQVAVDAAPKPDFKTGQFVGLRFTPMPYEKPLVLNAQIRSVLPTANNENVCLGLQMVGLEASDEGRQTLRRLCRVVERYYQINQSSAKQYDLQPIL